MKSFGTILLSVTLLLLSCSGTSADLPLREAESVVAEADSLWQAGQTYGDSTQLAQAYEKLGQWQWFYADEYAHACYHYGKLLRAKENPVEAMQVFIAATHSGTKDYHILGRVYSNIGSICHLAGEFPLSYDMYERSANCFLTDNDSLSYYFLLNDMAYELAEQGKKDSAFMVLEQIDRTKIDSYAIMKIFETKAEACLYAHMYDSAIYYTSPLRSYPYVEPEWLLIRAQAYSLNGENDSAVYYANRVLSITNETYHQNNALYILTNNDTTKDIEAVRVVAADRADVQKLIEIKRSKCAQAVQLLEQDLLRTPDYRWLIAIITTILLISLIIWIYRTHQKKKHALLSQQVEDLANAYSDMQSEKVTRIEQTCKMLRQSDHLQTDLQWQDYNLLCDVVNKNFYMMASKLKATHLLNEREIRMCILVLIGGFTGKQMAQWLYYAESGIRNLKNHTARKLGTNSTKLREFLLKLAIDGYIKEWRNQNFHT